MNNETNKAVSAEGSWVSGLSVREHFAAMAMQGLLAHDNSDGWTYEDLSSRAVRSADALLAELAKEPK